MLEDDCRLEYYFNLIKQPAIPGRTLIQEKEVLKRHLRRQERKQLDVQNTQSLGFNLSSERFFGEDLETCFRVGPVLTSTQRRASFGFCYPGLSLLQTQSDCSCVCSCPIPGGELVILMLDRLINIFPCFAFR